MNVNITQDAGTAKTYTLETAGTYVDQDINVNVTTKGEADKLKTARNVYLSGGASSTTVKWDGSTDLNIPVTGVPESYLTWGGKLLQGNVSATDAGCIDEFGHNKLAFLPAECIKVEYSTDGGNTWNNYSLADYQKTSLVSTASVSLNVVNGTGLSYKDGTLNADNYMNYKLRVTICTASLSAEGTASYVTYLYTAARKLLVNVSTNGAAGVSLDMYRRPVGDFNNAVDNWIKINSSPYVLTGWSGWNSIPFIVTFGGAPSQTSNMCRDVRLEFGISALSNASYANTPQVLDIRMIGVTNWTTPSEMSRAGHLYSTDTVQTAIFPNDVRPVTTNTKNLGTSSYKWANVYASTFYGDLNGKINNHTVNADVPSNAKFTDTVLTESDVSGWGFTKNTGTYSKPSGGIPKTDLASAVQTSLGKADTALQEHQDISGKMDKSNPAGTGTFTMGASSSPNTAAHEAAIRSYRTSGNAGGNAINAGAVGTESMALTSDSAPGYRSVALNCSNLASGTRSFATGCTNASLGGYSSTFGQFNIAKGDHQMVLGRRNVEDTAGNYAMIIGNGSINTTPISTSNAMAVDWDGNAKIKGDIYVGCNADSTGGTKLENTTESDVSGWGFTKNTGTVTAVKINGTTKNPTNGVVDLGTISGGGGGITSETDPIFSASAAAGITSDNITAWNNIVSKFTGTNPIGTILTGSDTTAFAITSTQASNDTWVKKASVTLTPGTWWIKAGVSFAGYTGTSGTTNASAGRRSIGLSSPNTASGSIATGTRSDTYCAAGTMATIQTMYPVKVTSDTTYTVNIASSTAVRVTASRIYAMRTA